MSAAARRTLPARADLDQQRKLAKELLADFRRGDADASARIRAALPDKSNVGLAEAQHVLAREYGFETWAALKQEIEKRAEARRSPLERAHRAVRDGDAPALRRLLAAHAELRSAINQPVFPFDSPALVAISGRGNVELVDVLLEFGADPNLKSSWWAGGFHPLYGASPAVAERLLAAGAVPDTCAAAHLDRPELLERMLAEDPARVHERGGDGQMPLHFARSQRVVDLLLGAGADVDARDVDHRATAVSRGSSSRGISSTAARRRTSSWSPRWGSPTGRGRCSSEMRRCSRCGPDRASTARSTRAASTSICGRSARTSRRSKRQRNSDGAKRSRR
jgi:hypothetical protein